MTPQELTAKLLINPGDGVVLFVRDLGWLPGKFITTVDHKDGDGFPQFVIQRDGCENPTRVYVDHVVLVEKAAA